MVSVGMRKRLLGTCYAPCYGGNYTKPETKGQDSERTSRATSVVRHTYAAPRLRGACSHARVGGTDCDALLWVAS